MAHLKLVAGTAVTNAAQVLEIPTREAQAATSARADDRELRARTLIYGLKAGMENLTVKEILAELNSYKKPSIRTTQRNGDLRSALLSIGIHAHSALPDDELDVDLYGLVIEPRKLFKAYPALKSYAGVLDGLTL